ncbi:MAG: hypothetical protein M0P66_11405, partial [Salinivirgaceae bacterium]|nr:hypothetical protein [Salinivirgaceae bacterium]
MKRIHLFIYLFIISFISNAQINQYGIPFISNYTPKEYNAGEQNWCIVEDFRGVIYFGNNYILEFDGVNWRKIPVANNSIIRSLNVDHQGRIYVGAVGEFGYLMPSVNGTYQYYSLIEKLDTMELDFSDIWKTYIYDNHVYFCAYNKIFDYSNDSVKVINLGKTNKFSFLIGSSIYNEDFFSGLKKLNNDSLVLIPSGAYYRDKDIFYMEEFDDNQ